jgi:hypothetical protein
LWLDDRQYAVVSEVGTLILAYSEWVAVVYCSCAMGSESSVPCSITFWVTTTHLKEAVDRSVCVQSTLDMDTILARDNDSKPESVWIVESRVL